MEFNQLIMSVGLIRRYNLSFSIEKGKEKTKKAGLFAP